MKDLISNGDSKQQWSKKQKTGLNIFFFIFLFSRIFPKQKLTSLDQLSLFLTLFSQTGVGTINCELDWARNLNDQVNISSNNY